MCTVCPEIMYFRELAVNLPSMSRNPRWELAAHVYRLPGNYVQYFGELAVYLPPMCRNMWGNLQYMCTVCPEMTYLGDLQYTCLQCVEIHVGELAVHVYRLAGNDVFWDDCAHRTFGDKKKHI
jgi:hypothetical protein